MREHPELFSHIPQAKSRQVKVRESLAAHVQTAERLAKEYGIVPGSVWLYGHHFIGLYSCMRNHPELFSHIPQTRRPAMKPFEEARDRARTQEFNSRAEYARWAKNIAGMPVAPGPVYKDKGWAGWNDFLGTEIRPEWLPFAEAKAVVRAHEIKTLPQFRAWDKQERLANKIPTLPSVVYRNAGWIDWYDFLSTESPSLQHVQTAEQFAVEDGIVASRKWLRDNGHGALDQYIYKHPELFSHIPQQAKKLRKQAEKHYRSSEHVQTAEQLATEHGVLPGYKWLRRNGFSGLYRCMRMRPELFAHIPRQESKFKTHADCHPDRKHNAHGLCSKCYHRERYERKRPLVAPERPLAVFEREAELVEV